MKLNTRFPGLDSPFEGDRTLHLRNLPADAQIKSARFVVTPRPFATTIQFEGDEGGWGTTLESGQQPTRWTAVDLHTQRKITGFRASSVVPGSTLLQIDMGGVWVQLGRDGNVHSGEGDPSSFALTPAVQLFEIPPLKTQRFKLQRDDTVASAINLNRVTIVSNPSNLTVNLGDGPPIWVKAGELTQVETSPDLATPLQDFLATAKIENGFYDVPLVVHSDTIATFDLAVEIDYTVATSVLPAGVNETVLPYDHNGIPLTSAKTLMVQLPVGARVIPGQTTGRVVGAFDDSRVVHGPTGSVIPTGAVPVAGGLSQAQPILLEQDTAATAIDLLLQSESRTAELDLILLNDTDGQPGITPMLDKPIPFNIDRDVAATPTWISVTLDKEFQFKQEERVWLMVQARSGETCWSVAAGEGAGLYQTDNGGLSWRPTVAAGVTAPLAAHFRLRHVPPTFKMPIELEIGQGEAAKRVSLDRFAPTRRVDFDLNFDDVAHNINAFLDSSGAVGCPEGEHLLNGDFAAWSPLGDAVMAPQSIVLPDGAVVLGVAADDSRIYAAGAEQLMAFDPLQLGIVQTISLASEPIDEILQLLLHPNGREALLVAMMDGGGSEFPPAALLFVDLDAGALIGSALEIGLAPATALLTHEGERLNFITNTGSFEENAATVLSANTQLFRDAVASNNTVTDGGFPFAVIPVATGRLGTAAIPAADRQRMIITLHDSENNQGEIAVVEIDTLTVSDLFPIAGCQNPTDLTAVPGTSLVVVLEAIGDSETRVFVVDLDRRTAFQIQENPTLATAEHPSLGTLLMSTGVAAPAGGRWAFIANDGQRGIAIADLDRRQVVQAIARQDTHTAHDILATRQGDAVFVLLEDQNSENNDFDLLKIPLGVIMPDEWTLTGGALIAAPFGEPFKLAVGLGVSPVSDTFSTAATALSQVVPVQRDCPYQFSFWGRATAGGTKAEIIWRGGECGADRIDEIDIEPSDRPVSAVTQLPGELVLHRLRVTAPAGATQAEIRFSVPPNEAAVVDLVTFGGSLDAVENGDFQQATSAGLAGWTLSPAGAVTPTFAETATGVAITNSGGSPITLAQTVAVAGDEPFTLIFDGQIESETTAQPPVIELRWRDAGGGATGAPTTLTLDAAGPNQQILGGTAPAGAVEAELAVVLPGHATVTVSNISYRPVQMVEIPLNFIAQAPGELSITDFQVSYETVATTAVPAPPADGLCSPTPPGSEPGEDAEHCCHCPCCGGDNPLANPQPTTTSAGRPAITGRCPDCGAAVVVPGGRVAEVRPRPLALRPAVRRAAINALRRSTEIVPAARSVPPPAVGGVELSLRPLLDSTPRAWAELAGIDDALRLPPLTIVDHIGPARAERLAGMGFPTLDRLAACDPTVLAAGMRGVTVESAEAIIADARVHMAIAERRQAPLVSAIMPTFNRPHFIPQALRYFERQTYPNLELVIVDDGDEPLEPLLPADDRLRYVRLDDRLTIGEKMNIGCEVAGGEWLVRWEDDVWMADWRIAYQMAALFTHKADLCGPDHYLHYDLVQDQAWISRRPAGRQPWILGSTLAFTRRYWAKQQFPNMRLGDEIDFIRRARQARVVVPQSTGFSVDIIHGGNTAPKNTGSDLWHPFPLEKMEALMGDDINFYRELSAAAAGTNGNS